MAKSGDNLWIARRARKRLESACYFKGLQKVRYFPAEKSAQLKRECYRLMAARGVVTFRLAQLKFCAICRTEHIDKCYFPAEKSDPLKYAHVHFVMQRGLLLLYG